MSVEGNDSQIFWSQYSFVLLKVIENAPKLEVMWVTTIDNYHITF